jgi:LysM repeat protein
MKSYKKIVLLVVMVLFIAAIAACTRQASTNSPVATATTSGEAPFPFVTPGGVSEFGTQTAIALMPQATSTPVIVIETTQTPAAVDNTATNPVTMEQTPTIAPTTGPAVNTPVVARPQTYALQHGEWPLCIARRYGLDVGALLQANGLNMNSRPSAGTTLNIPATGDWSDNYGARSLQKHPTTYTVASGDTIYTIACRYGDVAPESILAVNNLTSGSSLTAGQTLQIP